MLFRVENMSIKLLSVLIAGAAADITTSFWMPAGNGDPTSAGFVASVIGAGDGITTVAYAIDNETNPRDLGMTATTTTWTMTIGPEHYEWTTSLLLGHLMSERPTPTGDFGYHYECHKKSESAECTSSFGIDWAIADSCSVRQFAPATATDLVARAESTEESLESFQQLPTLSISRPDWCDAETITSVPEEAMVSSSIYGASELATYKMVITAGEEKLGATAGTTGAGGAQGTGGTVGTQEGTGIAMPMKTAAPALAGLGAAVAAFLI